MKIMKIQEYDLWKIYSYIYVLYIFFFIALFKSN